MKNRKQPLFKSFGYAFEGIWTGISKERNMKIHCLAVILVTAVETSAPTLMLPLFTVQA